MSILNNSKQKPLILLQHGSGSIRRIWAKDIVRSQCDEIIIVIYLIASHEIFHRELLTLYTGKDTSKILNFYLWYFIPYIYFFVFLKYNTTTVWSLLHKSLNTAMDITPKQFTIPVAVLLKIPIWTTIIL